MKKLKNINQNINIIILIYYFQNAQNTPNIFII